MPGSRQFGQTQLHPSQMGGKTAVASDGMRPINSGVSVKKTLAVKGVSNVAAHGHVGQRPKRPLVTGIQTIQSMHKPHKKEDHIKGAAVEHHEVVRAEGNLVPLPTPHDFACSRCGAPVDKDDQEGRCIALDCEPAELDHHDEALPWEEVHGAPDRQDDVALDESALDEKDEDIAQAKTDPPPVPTTGAGHKS